MNVQWNRQITQKLIYLLKKQECLWDVNCPERADREKKKEAWESIQYAMRRYFREITVAEIKTKVLSLRSQYRKELRHIRYSIEQSGGKNIRQPSLWCFHDLDFLRPTLSLKFDTSLIRLKTQPKLVLDEKYESSEENETLDDPLSSEHARSGIEEELSDHYPVRSRSQKKEELSDYDSIREVNTIEELLSDHSPIRSSSTIEEAPKQIQRKYEWLGEQVVSTLNEMKNPEVIDEAIIFIQREIMNFKAKDRSFNQQRNIPQQSLQFYQDEYERKLVN